MDEAQFWVSLEYRVCREMEGLEDCRRLGLWCDGFSPYDWLRGGTHRSLRGGVWIGEGPRNQELWSFELFVPNGFEEIGEIDWRDLLPADDVTGWLAVDADERRLEIWPSKAVSVSDSA